MLFSPYVGYCYEANDRPVDEDLYVDYDYD